MNIIMYVLGTQVALPFAGIRFTWEDNGMVTPLIGLGLVAEDKPTGFSCRYNIRNYVEHKFGTHMLIMVQ